MSIKYHPSHITQKSELFNFHIFRVFLLHSGNLHYYYFCYFQNSQERTFGICSSSPLVILLTKQIIGTFFTQNSANTSNATTGGSRSHLLNNTRIKFLSDFNPNAQQKSNINGTYHAICSNPAYPSETAKYISWFASIVFLVIIVIGNILILLLTRLHKSLDSPMFVTIQSLSAISLIRTGFVIYNRYFSCTTEMFISNQSLPPNVYCYIRRIFDAASENAILHHLLILTGQRILMTVFPLQSRAYMTKSVIKVTLAVVCLVGVAIQVLMVFAGTDRCANGDYQHVTPFVVYRFVLVGMMAIMFVLTTVISAVFARISASKLLSTGQRQQSMVATVVMVLYMITYCSFTALQLIMYTTCPDDTLGYEVVDWLLCHIKLCLYAINPILLCLRMKSVRTSLYRFICMKGKSKKSN